ncbi:MAG: biliverdin-producing heme oxygenase [Minwuia sp.]|uniref:biliverdin-producing heme oxygenase n=1 Tax=Minwuia sp. TaxID=2493630 RepID=UPI003A83B931
MKKRTSGSRGGDPQSGATVAESNPPTQSNRQFLRTATAGQHTELDELLGQIDLGDPMGYRQFLAAHAWWGGVESWLTSSGMTTLLPQWTGFCRAGALTADLTSLGMVAATTTEWPRRPLPVEGRQRDSALWGAAYVLAGASLGARFLQRRTAGKTGRPDAFLCSADATQWPDFVSALDSHRLDRQVAAVWARDVFELALSVAAPPRVAAE